MEKKADFCKKLHLTNSLAIKPREFIFVYKKNLLHAYEWEKKPIMKRAQTQNYTILKNE